MGKTRLAVEVGAQVKASFTDGVWFVSLEAMAGSAEQIKIAIGEAMGLGQANKQLTGEQVIAILRDKQLLLILDNCEVVLAELDFIPQWLKRAPHVAILATSREPLNFQAETVVALDGLPTGDMEMNVAENMFAERGQMARADFAVSAENLPQVRQICQLVDGSPLGIALAATWVRRRSLAQILDSIGGSLDFLSTRMRDIDPRHRSLRAVFETSWQLLATEEQEVLAALSVFPTTFTAEAAAHIAGGLLFDLDVLCEKSLLQQQQEGERYTMHSLVRQFAGEKLGERRKEVEWKFVGWYLENAGIHQQNYPQLQPEWHNFLEAIRKAHALQAWQMVLDFVAVLDEPWFRQIRFNDMREGLTLAVVAAGVLDDKQTLARSLLRLGEVALEQSQYMPAETHLNAALAQYMRLENGLGIAHTQYFLGRTKFEQAQDDEAYMLCAESKRIFAEEGDEGLGVAKNLNLLALWHIKKHRDFETAHEYLEKSVELQRPLPLSSNYVETLRHLARVEMMSKAYMPAENHLVEAADVSRQLNNVGEYAAVLYERLLLCKKCNQYDEALKFGYECLDNFKKLGSLRWEALIKTQLGVLHQTNKNFQQALGLLKEGLQIFVELEDTYEQAHSYHYLCVLYADMGEIEQSQYAKEQALLLNLELNDPLLTEQLK
jgi:tetratricopeptide (TPR) repeat protein